MLGEVYALNTVIDDDRDLVHVNFGEVIASHLEPCVRRPEHPRAGRTPLHDDPHVRGRASARQDVLPDGQGHGHAARHPRARRHADRRVRVLGGLRLARVPRCAGAPVRARVRCLPADAARQALRRRRRVADRDAAQVDARRPRAALHDRSRRRRACAHRRRSRRRRSKTRSPRRLPPARDRRSPSSPKDRMSSPWSPDGRVAARPASLASISISSAASRATCSWPPWSTRFRRSRRRSCASSLRAAARRRHAAFSPTFARRCARAVASRRRRCPRLARSPVPRARTRAAARHLARIGDSRARSATRRWIRGTRRHALALLALLGEAEAQCTASPLDDVHFHELADWDSLMDIVAAGCIAAHARGRTLDALGAAARRRPHRTAHGLLPVPAPATSALLEGYPWRDDGVAASASRPPAPRSCATSSTRARRRTAAVGGRLAASAAAPARARCADTPNMCARWSFERRRSADVRATCDATSSRSSSSTSTT